MPFAYSYLPTLFKVALSLSLLAPKAGAQNLKGCDLVPCPLNQYGVQYCPIANVTATAIGVSNFTTSLSPDPLTWTTTISFYPDPQNSSMSGFERGYLLGLPPTVDLSSAENVTGCALFFDEISSKLKFPGNDTDVDTGTCQDAMGALCVADLQSQARSVLANLSATVGLGTTICSDLESALHDTPPASCSFLQDGTWGSIHARGK
jgi:hypothetical protein